MEKQLYKNFKELSNIIDSGNIENSNIGELSEDILNIMYGLGGMDEENLLNLWNQEPDEYFEILQIIYENLSGMLNIETEHSLYVDSEENIDPAIIFFVNRLFHEGIFLNFMALKSDDDIKENIKKFYLIKKKDILNLLNHKKFNEILKRTNNSSENIKYGIYQIYRIFGLNNGEFNQFENIIPENKNLYSLELIDYKNNKLERLLNSYEFLKKTEIGLKNRDLLNGIYIQVFSDYKNNDKGYRENFILSNINELKDKEFIDISSQYENNIDMFISVMTQRLNSDDMRILLNSILEDGEIVDFNSFFNHTFNINYFENKEDVISTIYNLGLNLSIKKSDNINVSDIKFGNYDIKKKFFFNNIKEIDQAGIPIEIILDLFKEDINSFFENIKFTNEILTKISIPKINDKSILQKFDENLSDFNIDSKEIENIISKIIFNLIESHVFYLTLKNNSIDLLNVIIKENKNSEIESILMKILKEKTDINSFIESYLQNIFNEASITDKSYIFSYEEIYKTISEGENLKIFIDRIFDTKVFQSLNEIKMTNFLLFLIENQKNEGDILIVLNSYFEKISILKIEFLTIISQKIIYEVFNKRNVINTLLSDNNALYKEYISLSSGVDNPGFISKISSFFKDGKAEKEYNELQKGFDMVDKRETMKQKLLEKLNEAVVKIDNNLNFLNKYGIYFEENLYKTLISDMNENKLRLLKLKDTAQ